MKRKYYLRGLGLGILVTALIFIIIEPSRLTDDEIIKRAEELGYSKADETVVTPSIGIKDLLKTPAPSPTMQPEATEVPEPTPTEVPEATLTPEPTPTEVPEATLTPEPTPTEVPEATLTPVPTPTEVPEATLIPEPTPTEVPEATLTPVPTPEAEVITAVITVERDNTATMVCNKIAAAGIVKDVRPLRNYFIENNLTGMINIGEYTLSSDMSIEEIVDLLIGR